MAWLAFGWCAVRSRILPWAILLVAAVAYPLGAVADGSPSFPNRADCITPAKHDGNLEAVFGRFATSARADAVLRRALKVGFKGTLVEPDGCGLLKVTLHGIPTLEVGRDFIAEARTAGFNPRLEQSKP
jgi:hypothetical protein